MKRRKFLAALFAAPSAAAAAVSVGPNTGGFVTPRSEPVLPVPATSEVDSRTTLLTNIGAVHAGVLRSQNSGIVIDLAGGRMIIRC